MLGEIELIKQEDAAIVQPAVSAEEASKQFKAFQVLKEKLLSKDDTMMLNDKPYTKKTGWRKLKTAFNLSEEIIDSKREHLLDFKGNPFIQWRYKVRVTAKNGVFADAEMSCDTSEQFAFANKQRTLYKPETAIMAMAQTRAFNRAISDLIGGGEVSAEEIEEPDQIHTTIVKAVPDKLKCVECDVDIRQGVWQFSMDKFKMSLCYKCQEQFKKNPQKLKILQKKDTEQVNEVIDEETNGN
jgi:hypothetical protein